MTDTAVDPLSAAPFVPSFASVQPPRNPKSWTGILAASAVLHVLFVMTAGPALRSSVPRYRAPQVAVEPQRRTQVTPLVEPPLTVLTQRAPNQGKVAEEFD
ncbi:MAG TPA: hypothetical protein VES20_03320, partial [Bryobacteraceae bacterium]|nr:hypothetical protein [Bryobacteraceae bacterium]